MFLALKRFNQAAIYLRLASAPNHTSFPCVLEDAGKINATKARERKAASEYKVLLFMVYCLLRDPGTLRLPGAGWENREVVIRMPKWQKVLLANAKTSAKKPIIYIGLAGER